MKREIKLEAGKVGFVLAVIGFCFKLFAEATGHSGISAILSGSSVGPSFFAAVGLILALVGGLVCIAGIIRNEAKGFAVAGLLFAVVVWAIQLIIIYR